jgi:hypothetical protein
MAYAGILHVLVPGACTLHHGSELESKPQSILNDYEHFGQSRGRFDRSLFSAACSLATIRFVNNAETMVVNTVILLHVHALDYLVKFFLRSLHA